MTIKEKTIIRFDSVEDGTRFNNGNLLKFITAMKTVSDRKQRLFIVIEDFTVPGLHRTSDLFMSRLDAAGHKPSIFNLKDTRVDLLFVDKEEPEPIRLCFLLGDTFNLHYQRKIVEEGIALGGISKYRNMNLIVV